MVMVVIVTIQKLLKLNLYKLTFFATNRSIKMRTGSVNGLISRAIISPAAKKKPTNEQTPPTMRQTKILNSSQSSLILETNMLKPAKRNEKSNFELIACQRIRFWMKKFSTFLILKWKTVQRVGLWNKTFPECQILNWRINALDFEYESFQQIRFWIEKKYVALEIKLKNFRHGRFVKKVGFQ